MSIAEKLQTVAKNEPRVYAAGRQIGQAEGRQEGFTEGYDKGYELGYQHGDEDCKNLYVPEVKEEARQEGYNEGVEVGKQAEYDAFWNQYQKNGKQNNYLYAFAGIAWTDEVYNPKYTIKPKTNASGMFLYSNVTDTKVTIDISELKQNIANMFANSQIKTIPLLIISETTPSLGPTSGQPFLNCSELENITIQGTLAKNAYFRWCPLTRESIENIISVLSDEAVGMTVDFKKSAVDTAFETSEGAADGSTSEEWLTLIATKSNWTISLV